MSATAPSSTRAEAEVATHASAARSMLSTDDRELLSSMPDAPMPIRSVKPSAQAVPKPAPAARTDLEERHQVRRACPFFAMAQACAHAADDISHGRAHVGVGFPRDCAPRLQSCSCRPLRLEDVDFDEDFDAPAGPIGRSGAAAAECPPLLCESHIPHERCSVADCCGRRMSRHGRV